MAHESGCTDATKTLANPLEPLHLRCNLCESKWFQRADDFKQHMRRVHPNVTLLLAYTDDTDKRYLFCPSSTGATEEALTYRRDATKIIKVAAAACIRLLLSTLGIKVTAWTAMAEIEGGPPIVVTDKGALRKLPAILNMLPSVRLRHKMARDLAAAEKCDHVH